MNSRTSFSTRPMLAALAVLVLVSWVGLGHPEAGPLTLAEAVERGLLHYPQLKAAQAELKAARSSFWKGILPPDPVASYRNEEVPEHSRISEYGLQTLEITQDLGSPLVTYYRARAGRHDANRARAAQQVARGRARADITIAYVDAWLDRRILAVSDSLFVAAGRLAEAAERRLSAGEITMMERNRFYSQAARLSLERDRARLEMEVAEGILSRMVGLPDVQTIEPVMQEDPRLTARDPSPENAFARRVEQTRRSLGAQKTAAKLSWLPDVSVAVFRQKDGSAQRYWGGSISLSLPLWTVIGGLSTSSAAIGELEAASARAESDLRSWQAERERAVRAYELTKKEVAYYEGTGLPLARRTYSGLLAAFEAGELSAGDAIAAFVETKAVQKEYLDSVRRLWQWRMELEVLSCSMTD